MASSFRARILARLPVEASLLAAEGPEVQEEDLAAEVTEVQVLATGVEPTATDQLGSTRQATGLCCGHVRSEQRPGCGLFPGPPCERTTLSFCSFPARMGQ